MYDIIIVGAGCAGLTAALYALRAGKKVLVLECESIGGQISYSPKVENFPSLKSISGSEFSSNLFDQVSDLGADFEFERVLKISGEKIKTIVTDYNSYECKAVIIATGVKHRKLGLAAEEKFSGRGVSYCAVCDGAFYKDKTVAVNGGGNSALQAAELLSGICKKVFLIHRRDSFRGELKNVLRLKKIENVEFLLNKTVTDIFGDDSVNAIELTDAETGENKRLDIDGLFITIGQIPDNDSFKDIVALDENGYIVAGENCKTSAENIFVAGDCRTKSVRQLTTAAADGAVAALAAVNI